MSPMSALAAIVLLFAGAISASTPEPLRPEDQVKLLKLQVRQEQSAREYTTAQAKLQACSAENLVKWNGELAAAQEKNAAVTLQIQEVLEGLQADYGADGYTIGKDLDWQKE